jgi:hypothetical protein
MKHFAILAAAVAVIACAQNAPAPAPAAPQPAAVAKPPGAMPAVVELTNPANGAKITLKTGGELKLLLDADPANATHWVNSEPGAPTLSPIGERVMVSKSVNVLDYSAGAWNIFRYRAEKPGNSTLKFEARRYDANVPVVRTVQYEVTVE